MSVCSKPAIPHQMYLQKIYIISRIWFPMAVIAISALLNLMMRKESSILVHHWHPSALRIIGGKRMDPGLANVGKCLGTLIGGLNTGIASGSSNSPMFCKWFVDTLLFLLRESDLHSRLPSLPIRNCNVEDSLSSGPRHGIDFLSVCAPRFDFQSTAGSLNWLRRYCRDSNKTDGSKVNAGRNETGECR